MRHLPYLSAALAAFGLIAISAAPAAAITNTSPAGLRAGTAAIDLTETVHCRRYLHRHGDRRVVSRGCGPNVVIVTPPRRHGVVIRDRHRSGASVTIRSGDRNRSGSGTTIRSGSDSRSGSSTTIRSGSGSTPSSSTTTTGAGASGGASKGGAEVKGSGEVKTQSAPSATPSAPSTQSAPKQ